MIPAKIWTEPPERHLTRKYNRAIMGRVFMPIMPPVHHEKPLKTRIIRVDMNGNPIQPEQFTDGNMTLGQVYR